jgi:hypothetical protein
LSDSIQDPKFVLATVPDPLTTHLRLEFDRANDGIEEAAGDEHYFFRRYWLPWSAEPLQAFSNRGSQEAEKNDRQQKLRFPGFLLFERVAGNQPAQSLIVFLVGEKPTDGINRMQFQKALELKTEILNLLEKRDPCWAYRKQVRLPILGTSFSGSLPSLTRALEQGKVDGNVVSGTVTKLGSIKTFNVDANSRRLRTLIHDSDTAICATSNYIDHKWNVGAREKIAVLYESETAFGAPPSDPKHWEVCRGDKNTSKSVVDNVVLIPFPREIAHLRNAYQEYPELNGYGSNQSQEQRKGLPLALEDSENTTDSIPDFAAQTPVSQETVVLQIANRLRHERIHFAVILGTDVLDVLFISRFMRAASPNVRLILFEPDLLLVHAADALPFEGMLAVTTYPLLSSNPPFDDSVKQYDADDDIIFSSTFEQGFHNAMRVLLADLNGKPPLPMPDYQAAKTSDAKPVLWITSIGREGYLPIAVLSVPRGEDALIDVPAGTPALGDRVHRPTRVWWVIFGVLTLGMASLIGATKNGMRTDARWSGDFRVDDKQAGAGERGRHLSLVLVFAVGIYLAFASTPFGALHNPSWWTALTCIFVCILMLGALYFLAGIWLASPPEPLTGLAGVGVAALFADLLVVLLGWLAWFPDNREGLFFAFRSLQIGAGFSPILPFLFVLAGFLIWAFIHLERCIFHYERRQILPGAAEDPVLKKVGPAARLLIKRLRYPFRSAKGGTAGVASLAFLLTLIGLSTSFLRSFEGWVYDWAFMLVVSALSAVLFATCWHFYHGWHLLRNILMQLETHQIRGAFSDLPPDHSWSPIWQTSPRKRSYLLGTRAIDCLNALTALPYSQTFVPDGALDAKTKVRVILDKVARGKRENATEHIDAQESLAKVTESLITSLQNHWNKGSSEADDNAINRPRTKTAALIGTDEYESTRVFAYQAEFVALRYLAFIRYCMLQLRNLLTFITAGFMALAFSLMCYPFQGDHLIGWEVTAIFGVVSIVVLVVFAQMETDATLSRITDTEAGKLGLDFYHRILSYGTLPLLTVLASHFNGVGQLLFSWIQPALKNLH